MLDFIYSDTGTVTTLFSLAFFGCNTRGLPLPVPDKAAQPLGAGYWLNQEKESSSSTPGRVRCQVMLNSLYSLTWSFSHNYFKDTEK
jgi:hypothetical protein